LNTVESQIFTVFPHAGPDRSLGDAHRTSRRRALSISGSHL
jgi:hypothetical protein